MVKNMQNLFSGLEPLLRRVVSHSKLCHNIINIYRNEYQADFNLMHDAMRRSKSTFSYKSFNYISF